MCHHYNPGRPHKGQKGVCLLNIEYIDIVNESHGKETMKAAVYAKLGSRSNGEDARELELGMERTSMQEINRSCGPVGCDVRWVHNKGREIICEHWPRYWQ